MKYACLLFCFSMILGCQTEHSSPASSERIDMSSSQHIIDSLNQALSAAKTEILSLKRQAPDSIANEPFNEFFWRFMTNKEFQLERIVFPLPYITWKNEAAGEIDTLSIQASQWEYEPFYVKMASERSQIYDNFDLKLRPTNERLLHWHGIETGGDARFFFEGIDGKWFLVKKEQLGT
ncbi:MAG: DUF4348 domain-containing protein [Bacteroidota bacterium]